MLIFDIMHTKLQTITPNSQFYTCANARALLRNNLEQPYMPELTLPNPYYVKRARVKVPWPTEEENIQGSIDLTQTKIYPNPSDKDFFAEVNLKVGEGVLLVYDVNGKQVFSKLINQGYQKISISTLGWSKGVYFGKVEVNGKVIYEEKVVLK